jgi:hypothetical protein
MSFTLEPFPYDLNALASLSVRHSFCQSGLS